MTSNTKTTPAITTTFTTTATATIAFLRVTKSKKIFQLHFADSRIAFNAPTLSIQSIELCIQSTINCD